MFGAKKIFVGKLILVGTLKRLLFYFLNSFLKHRKITKVTNAIVLVIY